MHDEIGDFEPDSIRDGRGCSRREISGRVAKWDSSLTASSSTAGAANHKETGALNPISESVIKSAHVSSGGQLTARYLCWTIHETDYQ